MTRPKSASQGHPRPLTQQLHLVENFFNAFHDVVFEASLDRKILWCNDAVAEVLGYAPEEVVGRSTLFAYKSSDEFKKVGEEIIPRLLENGSTTFETELVRKDKQTLFAEITLFLVRSEDQTPYSWVGFVKNISARKEEEHTLRNIAEGISACTGDQFFHSLVLHLAKNLGVAFALVGQLNEQADLQVETVAVATQGKISENFTYKLKGSPCERMMHENGCIFPTDVRGRFPEDRLLSKFEIESYVGIPLLRSNGKPLGLLVVLDTKPLKDQAKVESMLRIFALRAAAELERKQAEEALLESQDKYRYLMNEKLRVSDERYRVVAENIKDVFWMTNPEKNQMIYVSPAYNDLWGRTCESLYEFPRSFLDAIHPEDRPRVIQALSKQVEGTYNEKYRVVRPDKSIRWVQDRAFPIRNEAGEIVRVVGVAADITAQKIAEEKLEDARQFLDSIVENIPNMIFVKDAQDLRFVRLNKAGEELIGFSQDQLLGKNDHDFFPKAEADFFTDKDREVLEGKKLIDVPEETIQTAEKGSRILHTKKIPLYEPDGKPKYLLGISEDITERKELEKNLRFLARITEVSTEAIGATNERGEVTYWNKGAEKTFGFTTQEVMGKRIKDFLVPLHKKEEYESIMMSKAGKSGEMIVDLRTERLHKEGHLVPVLLTTFPVTDDEGLPVGGAAIFHDLTEIEKMEDKLIEQSKMAAIGKLAAGIAHEIRNPLFGISSISQILAREISSDKGLGELAKLLLTETNRLKKLLEDLLLYARPRNQERKAVCPVDLWNRLRELNQPLLEEKMIYLEADFVAPTQPFPMDGEQIYQVMQNLLLNAVEASPKEGTIRISSEIEETPSLIWRLLIHNYGPAVSKTDRENLFEPFFSTKTEGSGLGLSICKKIVEDHGGTIEFTSTPQEGTLFRLEIPADPTLTTTPKPARKSS